jgi:hypothetical protein
MKRFVFVFLFTIFVSAAFADVSGDIQMMTFMEYSDGKFYSQFVDLFNDEYGVAGFNGNIIPQEDKDFLIARIPSTYRSYSIVIMQYWLDNNTASKGPYRDSAYYLTVIYFNGDGKYVSSSWLIAH